MEDSFSYNQFVAVVCILDDSFMLLYHYVRRITNIVVMLVPLMALLVGSCKTSQTADSMYGALPRAEQVQTALFPDRANFHGTNYIPAAAYVTRARIFVEDKPQLMMQLTRDEIGYLFGKPSFQRHDADAEVWQYKTDACVVDFYFYGQKQLSYIDARHKDQTPALASDESSCLHTIS